MPKFFDIGVVRGHIDTVALECLANSYSELYDVRFRSSGTLDQRLEIIEILRKGLCHFANDGGDVGGRVHVSEIFLRACLQTDHLNPIPPKLHDIPGTHLFPCPGFDFAVQKNVAVLDKEFGIAAGMDDSRGLQKLDEVDFFGFEAELEGGHGADFK